MVQTHIHRLLPRKQAPAGRVQQQRALDDLHGGHHQQIELPVVAACEQTLQRVEEVLRDVPLEALLHAEELEEGRVHGQLGQVLVDGLRLWRWRSIFGRRCFLAGAIAAAVGLRFGLREADLGEDAFDLTQPFADLRAVVGGEVVEGDGEKAVHFQKVLGVCSRSNARLLYRWGKMQESL